MRPARRRIAWGVVAGAFLGAAAPAEAQQNPLVRGASSAPRVAMHKRLPLQVTQRAVTGLSPFPTTCGDTNGTVYVGAEVEPHVAVNPQNPNNIIGNWQQDRYSNGSSRGVMTGVSFDGGVTWAQRTIPVSVCTGGGYARATDPWVTFSPDGTAHWAALAVNGDTESAIVVSRSTDGGLTWSAPIDVIRDGAGFFNDKETITADPTDARFVYAVWDRLQTGAPGNTLFARTTNGGVSWEPARAIYSPGGNNQTIGNVIRVLPNGTLVNLMTVIRAGNETLEVIRSGDRGLTWTAPVPISNLGALGARDPVNNAPIRDGSILPQMAIGADGTIHVVWQDARFTQLRDSIAYSRSVDGGSTWSTAVRVNLDPGVPAFTPQVHVRDDGVIGITYYDFRSDTSSPLTLLTDFWLARSADGVHWTETRVSDPFDLNLAPNANGLFVGDYTGLASAGSTFIAFFGKTNAGAPANRTDIFIARIAPPPLQTALAAKRTGIEKVESAPYRAQPMTEMDPGPDFWAAASANAHRALEARRMRPGRAAGTEAPPAMR